MTELQYQRHDRPGYRISRTSAYVLIIGGFLVLATWFYVFYRTGWGKWKLTYQLQSAKSQCEEYLRTPDEVVYQKWRPSMYHEPPLQDHLTTAVNQFYSVRFGPTEPVCWKTLTATARPWTPMGAAPFFLHLLENPKGEKRLIWMGVSKQSPGKVEEDGDTYIIRPQKVRVWDIDLDLWCYAMLKFGNDKRPLTLYAGQPDPNDPTAFTLRYRMGGELLEEYKGRTDRYAPSAGIEEGVFRARLRDDDSLEIEFRAPANNPRPGPTPTASTSRPTTTTPSPRP